MGYPWAMADSAMRWPPELSPLPNPVGDETWDRFRQATIDLAIERGYDEFDVPDIVERARASRAEFDARFMGLDDCRDCTYEANIAEFDQSMFGPYMAAPSWREGIRAAIYGAAEYLRHHRRERRYGEIRKIPGGAMEMAARDRYLQRVVDLIDVGRCELSDPDSISRTTAEGVLGSIYKLVVDRLTEVGEEGMTWDLVDDVMYLAVRRYVGDEAGIQEFASHHHAPAR